jgi:GNAT superfamily N-acetyltransferase
MLRPATPDDAAQVSAFYYDIRKETVPPVHSLAEIETWLKEHVIPQRTSYVWEEGGVIQGWINVRGDWVDHLFCRPVATGKGLGSRLMDFAKGLSPTGLQLWTFQVNERARRFYHRHGFVEVELTDGANNEEGEPDVRLVWQLNHFD